MNAGTLVNIDSNDTVCYSGHSYMLLIYCKIFRNSPISLSILKSQFPDASRLASTRTSRILLEQRIMEALVMTAAIMHAKLQSHRLHQ